MNDFLRIKYEKYTLPNGLEVILFPDPTTPLTAVNIWYKVGSANEKPGKTGFAHLFEHMMFQGSKNVPKQMHFKYIQEAGGNLNGSTSFDRTNYYQTIPPNYLELVLWLESDRMEFLLPALNQEKLDNQIDVVKNERRQRYDNAPYGLAWQIIYSNLYQREHPYSWPIIGYMEDISCMTLQDVRFFFQTYYIPNNASLVIGGNFDISEAKDLVEKYFGTIAQGNILSDLSPQPLPLTEPKLLTHFDNVQLPRIYFTWLSEPAFKGDDHRFDVLADLLGGSKNSRLYKNLVFEKEIAQSVTVFQHSSKLSGNFSIIVTIKPGVSPDLIKEEVFKEISILNNEGVSANELQRARNSIKSSFIYSMQNIGSLADRINEYNFFLKEPDSFLFDLQRYQSITESEIQNISKKYLSQPYVELRILPKDKENQDC